MGRFYEGHASYVASMPHIGIHDAENYCTAQRVALLEGCIEAMDSWDTERVDYLAALALKGDEPVRKVASI